MTQTKQTGIGLIIHIFAVLHAAIAYLCWDTGISDQLILTLFTIVMTIIICYRRNTGIEFIATSIILVNIVGLILGTLGAKLLGMTILGTGLIKAVSSFATTEILGWSTGFTATFFYQSSPSSLQKGKLRLKTSWLIAAVIIILTVRVLYTGLFQKLFIRVSAEQALEEFFANPVAFLMMICLNVIYVRCSHRYLKNTSMLAKGFLLGGLIIATSTLCAYIAGSEIPFSVQKISLRFFLQLTAVASLAEISTYAVIYMIDFALTSRAALFVEREKANLARFQYMKLKQQVNPHFLFNSLNILDCLVQEEKTQQASLYIHKLAGIYRYMLRNEDEDLVTLREEMKFVMMYSDLLKVRFQEGFILTYNIDETYMQQRVIPCSIQLLIENAIKHNRVSKMSHSK